MTTKIPKNSGLSTRWWWVRHAPVTSNNGRMYGASDPRAEITTPEAYEGLANLLPRNAICVTSALQRTQQTLEAILSRGLPAGQRIVEPDLSEQNFGVWQGQPYERIPDLAAPSTTQILVYNSRPCTARGGEFCGLNKTGHGSNSKI